MATAETIEIIRERSAVLTCEIIAQQAGLDRLVRERDALRLALQSLENIQDDVLEYAIGDDAGGGLTYKQSVVFEKIPLGRQNALPPILISKRCPSIEPEYIRKTLKRLSEYGRINAYEGKYWREM